MSNNLQVSSSVVNNEISFQENESNNQNEKQDGSTAIPSLVKVDEMKDTQNTATQGLHFSLTNKSQVQSSSCMKASVPNFNPKKPVFASSANLCAGFQSRSDNIRY